MGMSIPGRTWVVSRCFSLSTDSKVPSMSKDVSADSGVPIFGGGSISSTHCSTETGELRRFRSEIALGSLLIRPTCSASSSATTPSSLARDGDNASSSGSSRSCGMSLDLPFSSLSKMPMLKLTAESCCFLLPNRLALTEWMSAQQSRQQSNSSSSTCP